MDEVRAAPRGPCRPPAAHADPPLLFGSGGPGASSVVFGFFGELGPYFMDDRSLRNTTTPGVPDLFDNPYAWNKIANVLCPPLAPPCTLVPRRWLLLLSDPLPPVWAVLESPANVGYSYCEDPSCRWDDTTVPPALPLPPPS